MDFRQIIIAFLGLQDVIVEDIKLIKKDLRAEIKITQRRDSCFCHRCGLQYSRVKEWQLKKIKGPPLGIFQNVTLKFYQLRGYCDDCDQTGVARVDWIHPKFESMTCGFAEVAGRLMEEVTCEAVGRILHCHSKTMWELDQYRMATMMQSLRLPKNLDTSYLCGDEVHFRTLRLQNRKGLFAKRWAPEFITNLVCPSEGKVLFNALGRDFKAMQAALSVLSSGQKLAVECFAVDMHEPFIAAAKQELPNAKICIDRFHLAQKINEAFDHLRKSEFKKARDQKDHFGQGMLEPHRRFVLVTRDKSFLSKSEEKLIDKLRFANHNIHLGMLLVEYFHRALDQKTIPAFRKALVQWCKVCRKAKIESFLKFAKTLRRYRKNIEAYITSRLTTATVEGLNNKIQVLKRMGYGYTNPISFLRKVLQRCGYLNHLSINTDEFFYKWPNPVKSRR